MSVIVMSFEEVNKIHQSALHSPDIKKFLNLKSYFLKFKDEYKRLDSAYLDDYIIEIFLNSAFWYGYLANNFAYTVQYQIDTDIFSDGISPEFMSLNRKNCYHLSELRKKLEIFVYNLATNEGRVFMPEMYYTFLKDLLEFLNIINILNYDN